MLLTAAFTLTGCASSDRATPRAPAPGPDFSEARVESTGAVELAASDAERPIPPDDQLFFAFDSDRLDRDGQTLLAQVAAWLRAAPGREIVVQGHADAAGDADYNMDLSSRRARAVAEHLQSLGVPRDRIIVVAEGERAAVIRPAVGNRRVVIFANTIETVSRR